MNPEINTYRFILTPIDKIFFGGEKSPFKEEYYQHSQIMPQQTAVLGFLRYEILRRSGVLSKSREGWASLIGERSFNASAGQTFGKIKAVSAVSVYKKDSKKDFYFLRNPKDFTMAPVISIRKNFGETDDVLANFEYFHSGISEFKRYDVKDYSHFADILTDFNSNQLNIECEIDNEKQEDFEINLPKTGTGVFFKDVRPGITKNYGGDPKDEGYFKTKFWRMMPTFAYSFIAKIEKTPQIDEWIGTREVVVFGGETSLYLLKIEKGQFAVSGGTGRVFVLTSDAYVDNKIYNYCQTIVSDTTPFRNLKTTTNDSRFTKRPVLKWYREPDGDGRNTEPAKVLLKKGSILIVKDDGSTESLKEALDVPAFNMIGYNSYKQFYNIPKGL